MLTFLRKQNYFFFELFLFAKLAAMYLSNIAINMLIQDKICGITHGQSMHFCQNIHEANTTVDKALADEILGDSTRFVAYKNLIECLPMVLWSLVVGSFLDNHSNGTVLMMLLNIGGEFFQFIVYLVLVYFFDSSPYLLLIGSLYAIISGGMVTFSTTAFRYISVNTPEGNRGFKFIILEIVFIVGIALAMFTGGQLLRPRSEGPQFRTYYVNFGISLILDTLALLLLFGLNRMTKSAKKGDLSTHEGLPNSSSSSTGFFKTLFNFEHIKDTLQCLFKPREHRMRLQIFILYFVLFITVITTTGIQIVSVQFTQKVYEWDVSTITTFNAGGQVLSMALLAASSAVLMKWLKLLDGTLILLSQLSRFSSDLLSGLILKPLAAYLSLPVGSLSGVAIVAIRTKLSKLVSEEEVGKIFSLSSTIEALVPLASSLIYSNLFAATISTYPGLIYLLSCAIVFVSMLIILFERFYCPIQSKPEEVETPQSEVKEKSEYCPV